MYASNAHVSQRLTLGKSSSSLEVKTVDTGELDVSTTTIKKRMPYVPALFVKFSANLTGQGEIGLIPLPLAINVVIRIGIQLR